MSDDVIPTTTEASEAPESPDAPAPAGRAGLIHEAVNAALAGHHGKGTVRDAVIEHLVAEQLQKRKGLALAAIDRIREARLEMARLEKGGARTYDLGGALLGVAYSKQDVEAMKKAKERLARLEKALADALDRGDYRKLEECCK